MKNLVRSERSQEELRNRKSRPEFGIHEFLALNALLYVYVILPGLLEIGSDSVQEYGAHDAEEVAGDAGQPVKLSKTQQIGRTLKQRETWLRVKYRTYSRIACTVIKRLILGFRPRFFRFC
jgi:hypothetical protein